MAGASLDQAKPNVPDPPACGVKVVEKPFVQGGTHTHTTSYTIILFAHGFVGCANAWRSQSKAAHAPKVLLEMARNSSYLL